MDDELYHYGTPRHSGRYPWGSGENPYQRNQDFLGRVNDLRKKGMSEVDIAKAVIAIKAEVEKIREQIQNIE